MGKEKHLRQVRELFKKSPVVKADSISRIINNKNGNKTYVKQLVHRLVTNGEIKRLAKGYYSIHNENSLVVFCFGRSYLGLQDALSLHGLWEQETIPVIITASSARQGIRTVMGTNILIHRINPKYFFGFDYYDQGFYLPYSDIEKTLIDMVYYRQQLDSDVRKRILKLINKKKLDTYLKAYPVRFRKKVLSVQDS